MKLREFLDSIGNDRFKIAEWMHVRGYTGIRGDQFRCVMANAIRAETGDEFVSVCRGVAILNGQREELPDCVKSFVCNFDSGNHPELERVVA